MKHIALTVFAFLWLFHTSNSQSLTQVWSTKNVLKVPEAVLFDPGNDRLYISNINGTPAEKNGEGFISLMDKSGNITELKWATGLDAPKGMSIKGDMLYVSDIDRVAEIDINTGKLIKHIPFPGAIFLNDVATGPDGNIYVTDTRQGVIYVLKSGKPEIWSRNSKLKGVNGITVEDDYLLIGSQGYLLKGNTNTGEVSVIAETDFQIDGLIPLGNGHYVVSAWIGKVLYLSTGAQPKELFDSKPLGFHTADMGYLPDKKILLIPTFTDRVIAKKLSLPY